MKALRKITLALGLLVAAALAMGACTPQEVEVIQTAIVEVPQEVEVTRVVVPTPVPAPKGGTLIESTFADASQLNPILSADTASSAVNQKIYLGLLTTDEFSGEIVGDIAEDWTVSDDGLVYTFNLKDGLVWSDGTPLTAHDVKFTYDAIASELVDTPRKSNIELVEGIAALDDHTLQITFNDIDCTALTNFGLGVLPAHKYAEDFSDIMDGPENTAPTVASGPFVFSEWVTDDHITLLSNPDYYLGAPNVDGWIYRVFADQSAELAATLAGEVDVTGVGPQFVSVIEGAIASGDPLRMAKFFDDGYSYVGFNMGDPENPEKGYIDENESGSYDVGEPVNADQAQHPILSDRRVRQAIAQSIDYTNLINKVAFGQGAPATANVLPAVEWAFDSELEGYKFDLEAAAALLDEAGWVEGPDGVRVKDGQQLELDLLTNAGNEVRENIVAILKDNLDGIGFDVTLDVVEFGTVVEKLLGQQFDMVVIGWTGLGSDPEDSSFWAFRNDDPGGGFNFVSYYNETVENSLNAARSLPGCATSERAELYKEVQGQIHEDAPYAFLWVPLGNVVWNTRVQGIEPGPWATYYNVQDWSLTQ